MVTVLSLGLFSTSTVDAVHGLGCRTACGIFQMRNSICVPCVGWWILNHWTPREVPLAQLHFSVS